MGHGTDRSAHGARSLELREAGKGIHGARGEGLGQYVHQQEGDRERDARELSSREQEAGMDPHGSTTFKPILRAMYDSLTGRMESI